MGTIQLKRGNNTGLAALTLAAGEPAFSLDTGKLYVGNGTTKVLINPDASTNSATATKLETARTIAITGDGTATSNAFDGSVNATMALTLADSGATAGNYTKVTVDTKGRVTVGSTQTAADIPTLTLSKISDAGTAANKNTGVAAGNIPILDAGGKINSSVLPALAITDTFVVATQVAMLALSTAEVGDIAVRTDLNKSFILKTTGASVLANWQELLTPTDVVQSVSGKSGAVTLVKGDVGLGNVVNVDTTTTTNIIDSLNKRMLTDAQEAKVDALAGTNTGDETASTIKTKLAITALSGSNTGDQDLGALALKTTTVNGHALSANVTVTATDLSLGNVTNESKATMLTSAALTEIPTAPTAATATNTTQVATTAFVKAQGYILSTDIIDGGTF